MAERWIKADSDQIEEDDRFIPRIKFRKHVDEMFSNFVPICANKISLNYMNKTY